MKKRHAEIAGAGFAGLTAAIALVQRGWSVRVHEMAPQLRAFGAGIFLWENGLRVLERLGVYEEVIANAYEAPLFDDIDETGAVIFSKTLPVPQGSRMVTMTRQDLYAPIVAKAAAVGVEIVTSSEAIGATPEGELILAGGKRLKADLVLGADGIRSQIRRHLQLDLDHQVFPVGLFRLLIPRLQVEVERPEWNRYINFWTDSRRVLYVPCNVRDLYVLLAARMPDPAALSTPINKDVWSKTFPALQSVFARIGDELRFDQYEVLHCKKWSEGRTCIIGDAAHAMPPTMGQGAGTAMMNALMLAEKLEEHGDIEAAFAAWETAERPLTEHTQAISSRRATEWKPNQKSERATWSDEAAKPALRMSSQPRTTAR